MAGKKTTKPKTVAKKTPDEPEIIEETDADKEAREELEAFSSEAAGILAGECAPTAVEEAERAIVENEQKTRLRSKYRPEFCKVVLDAFSNYRALDVPAVGKAALHAEIREGKRVVTMYVVPSWTDVLPLLGLKTRKGVAEWRKAFPEFDMACQEAEERQKDLWERLGSIGMFDSSFARYILSAKYGLNDKIVTENTNTDTVTVKLEGELDEWSK